jgi:hypothetical protein
VTSPILLASPRPQWELRQLKPLLARPGRASADSLPPTQAHSDTCRRSERLRQGHCNTAHRKHTEGVRQNKASEKKNSWTGVRAAGRCSRAERRKERKAPRLLNDTHANRALLANARVRLAEGVTLRKGSPCGRFTLRRLGGSKVNKAGANAPRMSPLLSGRSSNRRIPVCSPELSGKAVESRLGNSLGAWPRSNRRSTNSATPSDLATQTAVAVAPGAPSRPGQFLFSEGVSKPALYCPRTRNGQRSGQEKLDPKVSRNSRLCHRRLRSCHRRLRRSTRCREASQKRANLAQKERRTPASPG